MSNLRLINDTSFSNVATASVTDVFSSDFDIYKIVATGYQQTSGTAGRARLRLVNASGGIVVANNYDHAVLAMESFGSSFPQVKAPNVSYIDFVLYHNGGTGNASNGVWYIFNPFSSSYSFVIFQNNYQQSGYSASSVKGTGVLKDTSSMTGYSIFGANSGSFDVRFRTYGLRVDS
jgi:hypothetical protein